MLREQGYNRCAAVCYACEWAYSRNEKFYDFENIGGDCANFVSQCLLAGCCVMNFSKTNGWYYLDTNTRAPAWTSIRYMYDFLTTNTGPGPYAKEVPLSQLEIGDIVQLANAEGVYYHTALVTCASHGKILVTAHSSNAYMRPLSTYSFSAVRGLHILGCRQRTKADRALPCGEAETEANPDPDVG